MPDRRPIDLLAIDVHELDATRPQESTEGRFDSTVRAWPAGRRPARSPLLSTAVAVDMRRMSAALGAARTAGAVGSSSRMAEVSTTTVVGQHAAPTPRWIVTRLGGRPWCTLRRPFARRIGSCPGHDRGTSDRIRIERASCPATGHRAVMSGRSVRRWEVIRGWQRSVSVRTRPSRAPSDASTRRSSRAASSRRLADASTTRSRA